MWCCSSVAANSAGAQALSRAARRAAAERRGAPLTVLSTGTGLAVEEQHPPPRAPPGGVRSAQVGVGDGLIAVGAVAAGADSPAGAVAVWAPLLAKVALLAFAAFVDGAGTAGWWNRGLGRGVPVPVGGLTAGL